MKKIIFVGTLLALFFLTACRTNNDQNQDLAQDLNGLVYKPSFEGIKAFLDYQNKVDQHKKLTKLRSLFFTHRSGFTLQSSALLDPSGEITKAELTKVIGNGKQINYTFYFLKGVLSSAQIQKTNPKHTANFHLFFDANQRPIATYIQHTKNDELSAAFLVKNSKSLVSEIETTISQLSDMQNQEGEFELCFLGFSDAFNKKFIEFGNANYSTNLAYIPQEVLVQKIQKSPNTYLSKTFSIQYQEVTEASGFSYQLLTELLEK
jgi:hypothetical protein